MGHILYLSRDHSTIVSTRDLYQLREELTLHFYSSLEILRRKAHIVAEMALTQGEVSQSLPFSKNRPQYSCRMRRAS